ncbi:hypothetical protein XENOCAPTIV_029255 [Xenoophorus captivus]|uniref:Uncharacterized protein n=1 Tax=Xenoophorus captivus TaxID=1517983 RepID=A0ABV0S3S3_9TELE
MTVSCYDLYYGSPASQAQSKRRGAYYGRGSSLLFSSVCCILYQQAPLVGAETSGWHAVLLHRCRHTALSHWPSQPANQIAARLAETTAADTCKMWWDFRVRKSDFIRIGIIFAVFCNSIPITCFLEAGTYVQPSLQQSITAHLSAPSQEVGRFFWSSQVYKIGRIDGLAAAYTVPQLHL